MTSTKKLIEVIDECDNEELPEALDVYVPGEHDVSHVYMGDEDIHYQHEVAYNGEDYSALDIRYLPR